MKLELVIREYGVFFKTNVSLITALDEILSVLIMIHFEIFQLNPRQKWIQNISIFMNFSFLD